MQVSGFTHYSSYCSCCNAHLIILPTALIVNAGVYAFLLLHSQLCKANADNGVEHAAGPITQL